GFSFEKEADEGEQKHRQDNVNKEHQLFPSSRSMGLGQRCCLTVITYTEFAVFCVSLPLTIIGLC
ncbi:MAG: hypothetical protein OET90_03855, partial [Desulfuromonadales bacterium]|nr:hypothetical protein [Desulfuromonadales bacterium]